MWFFVDTYVVRAATATTVYNEHRWERLNSSSPSTRPSSSSSSSSSSSRRPPLRHHSVALRPRPSAPSFKSNVVNFFRVQNGPPLLHPLHLICSIRDIDISCLGIAKRLLKKCSIPCTYLIFSLKNVLKMFPRHGDCPF